MSRTRAHEPAGRLVFEQLEQRLLLDGASDIVHVQVDISYNGEQVLSTGWLVTRKE